MDKIQHSETASTIFQVFTIALMAIFSALAVVRGAGMMM
jgi:hypothetical protein